MRKSWHFFTELSLRVPDVAVDQLWLAGLMDTWTPPTIPMAPSSQVVDTLIHSSMSLRALASCVSDPTVQQRLAKVKVPAAVEGLQANPFLDCHSVKLSTGWFTDKLTALTDASNSEPRQGADLLIEHHLGRRIASEIDSASELGAEAWHSLRRPNEKGADLRFAVLSLVADPLTLIVGLLKDRSALVDWRCSTFVAAAVDTGAVTAEEIVCRFTMERGWASVGVELPQPTQSSPSTETRVKDLIGTFEALSIVDPVMASREVLVAWSELPQSHLVEVVAVADVETISDWLSGEIGPQPSDETLDAILAGVPSTRFGEIAAELARRPDVFASNPRIAGFANPTNDTLPPESVSVVAGRLVELLGADRGRWMYAATLLRNGWTGMLDELGQLAAAI